MRADAMNVALERRYGRLVFGNSVTLLQQLLFQLTAAICSRCAERAILRRGAGRRELLLILAPVVQFKLMLLQVIRVLLLQLVLLLLLTMFMATFLLSYNLLLSQSPELGYSLLAGGERVCQGRERRRGGLPFTWNMPRRNMFFVLLLLLLLLL